LNHARFVPLPSTVTKDEDTGTYYQSIDLLDAPLYFVPRKDRIKENQDDLESGDTIQSSILGEAGHASDILDDQVSDIDVDELGNQEEKVLMASQLSARQSDKVDLLDSGTDALELDIEGDDDVMDHIQPWKMRLHDESMRKQFSSPQPIQVGKRKRSASPTAPQQESQPKKPKKSVRFA
jgi:hypothetical protein